MSDQLMFFAEPNKETKVPVPIPNPKDLIPTAEAEAFIAASRWQKSTSKQYAKFPHSYTVREWTADQKAFDRFVLHIRAAGFKHKFFKATYIYWQHAGHYYWTQGWPVDETTVINRADRLHP